MIVIIDRPGQLCNRLWSYTPFIAFCLEHKITFKVFYFDKYHTYFDDINRNKLIKIGITDTFLFYRILRRTLLILRNTGLIRFLTFLKIIDEPADDFQSLEKILLNHQGMVLMKPWDQPFDRNLVIKHKNEIETIFSPKQATINYVNKTFQKHSDPSHTIVGVHIRRKDYTDFADQKYLYDDTIYVQYMNDMKNSLEGKSNSKVTFFLCSDEPLNKSSFKTFDHFSLEDSSAINDLYGLSKCDYIIGPPSTFSMWASFYGDVPLRFIQERDENIAISEFSPVIAQNYFADGTTFCHS